ncbi:MAG: hypothetical protein ACI4U5_04745 [Bacilli bacterium]
MIFLNKEDFFEIYLNSMLSNYDRDSISILYQPIIGYEATTLYFSLWSYTKQRSFVEFFTHDQLVVTTGMNITQIQNARLKLEAVGLLQTLYKNENNVNFYIYCLFAPKSPVDFLNDPLFSRLLREKLGEKQTQQLVLLYKNKPLQNDGYFDISASFPDVFRDDLDKINNTSKIDLGESTYGRKTKDISETFDSSKFAQIIETSYHISSSVLNKKLLQELAGLSVFYGVNEEAMGEYFSECFHPENIKNKVDLGALEERCLNDKQFATIRKKENGVNSYDFNSEFGKELEKYTTYSPIDYLSSKQNGTSPASSDVKVVNKLLEMGLTESVINVIVDYTLKNCSNVLSQNYATKIGVSIVREGIVDALDALNYIEKYRNRFKNKNKGNDKTSLNKEAINENNTERRNDQISDEELQKLMDSIEI